MIGEFVKETDVTVGTLAKMKPVYPYIAVCHYTVEFNKHAFPGEANWEHKVFSIPADASREEAAGTSRGIFVVKWPIDPPIVGNVQFAPLGIVECGSFSA